MSQEIVDQIAELLNRNLNRDPAAADRLAQLLFRHTSALCLGGEGARVERWFAQLPDALRHTHPVLAAAEVIMLARRMRYREAILLAEEIRAWREGAAPAERFDGSRPLPADFDFVAVQMLAGCKSYLGKQYEAIRTVNRYLASRPVPLEHQQHLRYLEFGALCQVELGEHVIRKGQQVVQLCRNNPLQAARTMSWMISQCLYLCQFARARDLIDEARAILARHQNSLLMSNNRVQAADLALWEGDYTGALQEAQLAVELAEPCGSAYQTAQAALCLADTLLHLNRCDEAEAHLSRIQPETMTRYQEVKRDALLATCYARGGRRDRAAQLISRGIERFSWDGTGQTVDFDIPVRLAEAALETGLPETGDLLLRSGPHVPERTGMGARLAWASARWAFRQGQPVAEPLQRYVALCEQLGLAHHLHLASTRCPDLFITGLRAGVASPLYPALLPEPDDRQLRELKEAVLQEHLPAHVRQVALQLMARAPRHPETLHAAAQIAAAAEPELAEAAQRLVATAPTAGTEGLLEVHTLGRFQVTFRGEPISRPWRRKAQALFALLLVQSPRPLNRSQLSETLWPDLPPRAAANNLRVTIHELRQSLARLPDIPAGVETDADTIRLAGTERIQWDARHLERLVEAARRAVRDGQDEAAAAAFKSAADLYRGDFLPGPAFESYFELERRHYAHLAYEVATQLAALCLDRGDLDQALEAAEAAVRLDPLDEEGHLLMMRVHADMGYPHRAAEVYRRYTDLLIRETGDAPSPQAVHLYQRLAVQ